MRNVDRAEDVQFPAAAVQQHAGSLDALADMVHQARSAVREVTMDTQAYGQLCQFLPGLLSPIFALAVRALGDTDDSLRETANSLRSAASSSTATDESAARSVATAGRPLGPLPELPL
jgi:excreted virulence factor EspC (type VII ESX diderm)